MSERKKESGQKTGQNTKPEPMPAGPEQSPAEQLTRGLGQTAAGAPPELPATSNNRGLRQTQVARLQRQQGNAFVQRMMLQRPAGKRHTPVKAGQKTASNPADAVTQDETGLERSAHGSPTLAEPVPPPAESHPLPAGIQREVKAGGGVEMTSKNVKVSVNVTAKTALPSPRYVDLEMSFPTAVSLEVKAKNASPHGAGVEKKSSGEQALKASMQLYQRKALAEGPNELANMARKDVGENDWEVDTVDWETELGAGEEEGAGKASVATAIKFTFKNGQSHTIKATLFEKTAGSALKGPAFTMEHEIGLGGEKLWEDENVEVVVAGNFKVVLDVKPDWPAIFLELAEKGGRHVARNFLRSALQGMVSFWLGAGGLIVGGIATIGAAAADIARAQDIKNTIKAAEKASDSYSRGYAVSWGVTEFGFEGIEHWFNKGKNDGNAKLTNMISQIQTHPVYAPYNFTEAELSSEIKARLSEHGAQIWSQVKGESQMSIYREFVLAFYEMRKNSFFTSPKRARRDAWYVAMGLGVDPDIIPEEEE